MCQAEPSYYSSMIIGIQTTKTRRQSGSWQTFFLLQMQPISQNIKRISRKKKAHLVARPVYRVFKTESTSSRQTEADRSWEKSREDETQQQQPRQQSPTMMQQQQQQQRSSSQSIRREKKGSVLVPRFGTSFPGLHLPFWGLFRGLSLLGISNAR